MLHRLREIYFQYSIINKLPLRIVLVTTTLASLVSFLLLYRHYSIQSERPLFEYLVSIRLIIPPAILVTITYIIPIAFGKSLQQATADILNNAQRLLFSSYHMLCIIYINIMINTIIIVFLSLTPPSFYISFVNALLNGEADDYVKASRLAKQLQSINDDSARQYANILQLFQIRHNHNFNGDKLAQSDLRPIVASLENDYKIGWRNNPLRWYSLGEAYSLLILVTLQEPGGNAMANLISTNELISKSTNYYDLVWKYCSPLATHELKFNALLNKGGLYYRLGRYKEALYVWKQANHPENLKAWGNIIAVLVRLHCYKEAVAEGEKAIKWTQITQIGFTNPSAYSGIFANTAFAQWMLGDFKNALTNSREAITVQDDTFNRLNYSLALVLSGKENEAETYLRSFMKPITVSNQENVVSGYKSSSESGLLRGYIIWAIIDKGNSPQELAAKLYATRGEPRTEIELKKENKRTTIELLNEIRGYLEGTVGLCSDYMLIPEVKKRLDNIIIIHK